MNEFIDKQMLYMFDELWNKLTDIFGIYIADAQAIAAIAMLLFFSLEAWKMMSGDKQLEIMPLLRPFAITMIIIFWGEFVSVIKYPTDVITSVARETFYDQLDDIDELTKKRYALIDSISIEIASRSIELERAENEVRDEKWYEFNINFDVIGDKIKSMWLMVMSKMRMVLMTFLEKIVMMFFQCCVYIILYLQIIFCAILIILGPLSFAVSIFPIFKTTYVDWLARFISTSLYSCIAYIILSVSCNVIKYGLMKEIDILESVMSNETAFIMYSTMASGDISIFMVTAIISGIAILTTPIVATWIIQTTGAGQAIQSMARAASSAI